MSTISSEQGIYKIKCGREIIGLDIDEIFYLEKQGNYIVYYTLSGKYKERGKMIDKYSQLFYQGFVRVHIGFMVNIKKIKNITKTDVILNNGETIPLGKKYKNDVKMRYYELMKRSF